MSVALKTLNPLLNFIMESRREDKVEKVVVEVEEGILLNSVLLLTLMFSCTWFLKSNGRKSFL